MGKKTLHEDLNNRFTYHAPAGDQVERYGNIREAGRKLAIMVVRLAPESRERAEALMKIDEAVMWANAAIARNE